MTSMHRPLVVFIWCLVCAGPPVLAQQKAYELARFDEGPRVSVTCKWRMRSDGSGPGYALALVDRSRYDDTLPAIEDWTEPNAPGVLAIAFDTDNPPPTPEAQQASDERPPMAWFDERGNFYDRPQREVSVHEDGVERLNVFSEFDYTTGAWIDATCTIRFEPGAAFITLILDGQRVLHNTVLPGVAPMESFALVVAGPAICLEEDLDLDDADVRTGDVIEPFAPAHTVEVFNEHLINAGNQRPKSGADFSGVPERVARVVATLTLSEPEGGYDHWDKKGRIGMTGADGRSYEVLRFITPFRRGWTWRADVTDLLPLFEDERVFEAWIETYMKGWNLSFVLDFYPGEPSHEPLSVVTLWDGSPEIGNPANPPSNLFERRTVDVPEGATHAFVRATATGHGMSPNTDNAGEFMPLGRTLSVSSTEGSIEATDPLWKTDVYLNPCRPQRGTWKFDRAGWAPGDLVLPWRVDVSTLVRDGGTLTIDYTLDDYLNEGRGETWAPHHWTTVQVVFMRAR